MSASTSPPSTGSAGRLWSSDFVLNLLAGHFMFACYSGLFTIIPLYVLDLGGQEWQLGLIIGSFGVAAVIIRPYGGRWTTALGARRVAVAGTVILAVGSLLYIPAMSVWWLVPVRVLQGIGLAIAPVATSTIVANLAPSHRRAEAMSYMGNSISLATLYSPVFAFFLFSHFGFTSAFIFSAAVGLLGAALALGMSSARIDAPRAVGSATKVPLVSRAALFPTFVFLSYTLTTAPVNTFLPILAEDRALGNPGLYFTVFSLTSIVTMFGSGSIADRVGRPALIIPGLLATAVSMFLIMGSMNQLMFLSAGFLTGLGFGLLQPAMQSLTVDRVRPQERSSALATLQQAWDVGGSGGSFILGPIAGVISVATTFGIVGVGAVAGAVGFVVGNARSPAEAPTHESMAAKGQHQAGDE